MTDNNDFYSPAGNWFWQQDDQGKKKIIADTIVRDCTRSNKSAYVMIVFCILALIYGIYLAVTDFSRNTMFSILTIGVSPIGVYMFSSALISMKRYIAKAREGRVKFRHVVITDRKAIMELTSNKFMVYMETTDEDNKTTAVVNIEKTLYEKTAIGLTGWFAMIEDESKKFLVSPYWFIPDNDTAASVAPLTPVTAAAGHSPSHEDTESILAAFKSANASKIGVSILAALMFLLGGLFILSGILSDRNKAVVLLGVLTCMAAVCIITVICITNVFKGKKMALLTWAIWLQFNVFGLFPIMTTDLVLPVRLAILASLLMINLGMTRIVNDDLIKTYRELKKGDYLIKPATVISINTKNRVALPFLITISTCIVSDADGNTYEVDITSSQSRRLQSGTTGSLISFEKNTNRILFF